MAELKIPSRRIKVDNVPTEGSSNLITSGAVKTAIDAKDSLPTQTGNEGKFLKTDGTNAQWSEVTQTTITYWEEDEEPSGEFIPVLPENPEDVII